MEMIKVFTKYDEPCKAVDVPYFKEINKVANWEYPECIIEVERLEVTHIEEGLEGVRFFHYE